MHDFWRAQLVHSDSFLDYLYEVWQLLSALYNIRRKNSYRIYILGSKLLQWNYFLKSLSYLYEVVRTTFSADFWTFRNFVPQFRENCGTT